MLPRFRSEWRFAGAIADRFAQWALLPLAVVLLAACGGGSATGGGTSNSPFVGTYQGSTTVTVSSDAGSQTASGPVTIFVNRDGLVQLGDAQATIYASGPLSGDTVRIDGDAVALVDPDCSGTIALAGTFEAGNGGGAEFKGNWSSSNTSCFGIAGTVSGPVSAARIDTNARASRVFETNNPVLRRVFRQVAG